MTRGHLRLHHDTIGDRKLRAVAGACGVPMGLVYGAWACVMIRASMARPRGSVAHVTADILAADLEVGAELAGAMLAAMESARLIVAGTLRGWRRRQQLKTDAGAAERMRRSRARKRAAAGNVTPVTASDVTGVTDESQNVTPVTSTHEASPAESGTDVTGVTPELDVQLSGYGRNASRTLNRLLSLDRFSALRRIFPISLSVGSTEVTGEARAIARREGESGEDGADGAEQGQAHG